MSIGGIPSPSSPHPSPSSIPAAQSPRSDPQPAPQPPAYHQNSAMDSARALERYTLSVMNDAGNRRNS